MSAVAIAGVGMMMVCSSSLAVALMAGGEEEKPDVPDTTGADDSGADDTDDTDDTDGSGGSGGSGNGVVWETETSESAKYKKLVAGTLLENTNGNTNACKTKCIANENCTGFNIDKRPTGNTCDLYSGDDLGWTSSDSHKGYKFNRTLYEESHDSGGGGNTNPFLTPSSSSGCSTMQRLMNKC